MAYVNNFATAGADPFFNWMDSRRDTSKNWADTPVIGGPAGYLEQNQDAAYTRRMGELGIGLADTTPFGRFVQDQFRNSQLGYEALLADNPTLTYQDYLRTLGTVTDFYNRFMSLTPQQRGVRYQGPTRTIADI